MVPLPRFWKSVRFFFAKDSSKSVILGWYEYLPRAFCFVYALGCEFCGFSNLSDECGCGRIDLRIIILWGDIEHMKFSFFWSFEVVVGFDCFEWVIYPAVLVWNPFVSVH